MVLSSVFLLLHNNSLKMELANELLDDRRGIMEICSLTPKCQNSTAFWLVSDRVPEEKSQNAKSLPAEHWSIGCLSRILCVYFEKVLDAVIPKASRLSPHKQNIVDILFQNSDTWIIKMENYILKKLSHLDKF